MERHRLLQLALQRNQIRIDMDPQSGKVLHFAAEQQLERLFRKRYTRYQTADLFAAADLRLNLEDISLPDDSYGLVIANHVLEHVDDEKAAKEIERILEPNGVFIAMVPIVEGWEETYENEHIDGEKHRWLHFGQEDHVRFYGRDFRKRIEKSGLVLTEEITATSGDVIKYGLVRGEKVFVFRKRDQRSERQVASCA